MSPDNEVIERSIREPAVFESLYSRHATSVYRYAAQRLGDHAAEDVMAETFLVAFERRSAYDVTVQNARPWLLGIATRLMRKHVRLEATAWKGVSADLAAQIVPDFIEQAGARIDAQRLARRLKKALRRLTKAERDTQLLLARDGADRHAQQCQSARVVVRARAADADEGRSPQHHGDQRGGEHECALLLRRSGIGADPGVAGCGC